MNACTCDPGPEGQHQWYCPLGDADDEPEWDDQDSADWHAAHPEEDTP